MKKLIIIGGATGSGKTALAIKLCKEYPQLVTLSADSRQVYKRLDIGTAKVGQPAQDNMLTGKPEPVWIAEGIPQYLIDIAEPNTNFTVAEYQHEAYRLIQACWSKGRIPLLVGGTGLYIEAVAKGFIFEGKVDESTRQKLTPLSLEDLQHMLANHRALFSKPDWDNRRRLIRALERVQSGLPAIGKKYHPITEKISIFTLVRTWEEQRDLAPAMVEERLNLGLVPETKTLLQTGVEREWLRGVGLSYRLVIEMLEQGFTENELKLRMIHGFQQLMRRQRIWFKKRAMGSEQTAEGIKSAITQIIS